jgi:hypothetical protein
VGVSVTWVACSSCGVSDVSAGDVDTAPAAAPHAGAPSSRRAAEPGATCRFIACAICTRRWRAVSTAVSMSWVLIDKVFA